MYFGLFLLFWFCVLYFLLLRLLVCFLPPFSLRSSLFPSLAFAFSSAFAFVVVSFFCFCSFLPPPPPSPSLPPHLLLPPLSRAVCCDGARKTGKVADGLGLGWWDTGWNGIWRRIRGVGGCLGVGRRERERESKRGNQAGRKEQGTEVKKENKKRKERERERLRQKGVWGWGWGEGIGGMV